MEGSVHRMIARRAAAACLAMALCAAPLAGCRVFDKDRRIVTEIVAEKFVPESMPGKVLLFPVWLPIGAGALVVDGFAVNPVLNAPGALDDGLKAFVGFPIFVPAEVVVLPVRCVGYMGIFVVSEVARCAIPLIW